MEQRKRQNKRKTDATREKILSAAIALFCERGYAATRIKDIADKAKIAVGLMYHYYKSKEEVFGELMKCSASEIEELKVMLNNTDCSVTAILLFAEEIIKELEAGTEFAQWMVMFNQPLIGMDGIEWVTNFMTYHKRFIDEIVSIIEFGQKTGEFVKGDPKQLAQFLIASIQGVCDLQLSLKNFFVPPTPKMLRNLIGRVGRIKYNLFGNVFLSRTLITPSAAMAKFETLLKNDVPEQRLSIVKDLSDAYKRLILWHLTNGRLDIPNDSSVVTENDYPIVRKFALMLLRDILKDRTNSVVYKEFDKAGLLTPEKIKKIKDAFAKSENEPDDDINNSVDQTNSLAHAIEHEGLEYPKIYVKKKGRKTYYSAKYKEVLKFLEELHRVFRWEIYERKTVGNKKSLTWYATLLCKWVSGFGLRSITAGAIENAQSRMKGDNPKTFKTYTSGYQEEIPYDDGDLHRNLVINEALYAIENTILFTLSNHFVKFTECYERIKKKKVPYDWYEYVEYGSANPMSIMFQRSGLSREASLYIRDNEAMCVVHQNGRAYLKRSLADNCPDETVRQAIEALTYNAPELFMD